MLQRILFRVRAFLQRPRAARELDDELQFHLEMETRKRIEQGTTPAEARRQALIAFGGVDQTKEAVRDVRASFLDALRQDVRFAARTFQHNPGFTVVAVLTLALGIGANTAIFSLIDAILFRPLPYGDPGRLVWVMGYNARRGSTGATISALSYDAIAKHHRGFEATSCSSWDGPSFSTPGDDRTTLDSTEVCGNLLDVLGVRPVLGRRFLPQEGFPGNDGVAVLTYAAWRRYFRGDPTIVGRTVSFKERPMRIVGVLPADFVLAPFLAFGQPDLLIPTPPPSGRGLAVMVARLKRGVSVPQAQAEVDALDRGMQAAEGARAWTPRMKVGSLQQAIFEGIRPLSMVLFASALLVLLLAIVNLANLLLARGAWRERELAIRASLGAGRARLVRQLLVEGVILSVAGGLIGLGLARSTFDVLHARVPSKLFSALPSGIDRRVLAFTFAISVLAGIASAILPALRTTGSRLARALQDGPPGRALPGGRRARGTVLVVTQMSLVVVILTAAGLMLNSLVRALTLDLGFRAERVVQIRALPPRSLWQNPPAAAGYYRDLAGRVAAMPGVTRVAGVCTLTLGGVYAPWDSMLKEGPRADRGARYLVTADYFGVLGIRFVRGRAFTRAEVEGAAPVAIVNEAAARRLWPGESPLHKQFRTGDEPPREVVGVVADTRDAYNEPVRASLYVPPDPTRRAQIDLVALVDGDAAASAAVLRKRLDAPGSGITVKALSDTMRETTAGERFQTLLLALFAALALLLAAVGIAGIVGYTVARRTREIGIRLALGAPPPRIAALVVRQSLALVVTGAILGAAAALAVTRVLTNLLFQVKPNDPATFAAAIAALLAVAVIASLLPALRASRVDPIVVLRAE